MRLHRAAHCPILVLLLFVGFGFRLALSQVSSTSNSESASSSSKPDYSKESFVIERLKTRYLFQSNGIANREVTMRVRVQSEAGVRQWGQLQFGYNSANERLEIRSVRVLKPDGTAVTVGAEAVQELTLPIVRLAPIYTDYKQKHVTVPSLRPGDILEMESATIGETAVAANEFWMLHDFQKTAIVLEEQLEVDVPAERPVKVKSKAGVEPKISEQSGRRVYQWSSSHLVREEENKDPEPKKKKKIKPEDELPDVQLTSFTSWEEVGRWYQNLEKDQRVPTPGVRAKADELTKGLQTDLEKIQATYEYTSTNFRYVSLSLGMGRYQPHSADEVLRNQYGDCKDKNTLFEALLDAEGIHASAVLMNAYRKLDADIPSPSQLNHVITVVPLGKDEVWMDTTAEVAPFRLVPYPLRHKQALLVSSGGTPRLVETPSDPAIPSTELLVIEGAVDAGGTLNAKISYDLRGDSEILIRHIFRSVASAQWQQIVENMSAAEGLGKDVTEVNVADTEAIRQPFTFSYRVSKPGYLDWTKQKIDFKLPLTIMSLLAVDPDDRDNTDPTKLGPSNSRTYKLRLDLPSKYTVHVPVSVSVKRDYGAYEANYHVDGTVLTAERSLTLRLQELPADRVQDYIAFRRTVIADVAQVASLESSASVSNSVPEGMKTADLIKNGVTENKNGNYKLAIELLKRAVAAEPKDRNAWNELGLSYFNARQDDPAISAFEKQIEIDAYHQYAYNNLGRVYLRQRKYDEAIKWFRKQIEIVPLDKYAHANLGYALVESHKWQDAVPELQQAASLTPNNAGVQIRLGEAYLKLGQEDKALSAFEAAVKISPTAGVWNDVAYQLALNRSHLDLAQNYAESAVSTVEASLRTLSLDQISSRNVGWTSTLGNSWDTVGWIAFQEDDVEKARKYVFAAWELNQNAEEADHLAQICKKTEDHEGAVRYYGLAENARRPSEENMRSLVELMGDEKKAQQAIEKYKPEILEQRTLKIANTAKASGTADFFILLRGRSGADAPAREAKFMTGDRQLEFAADLLQSAEFHQAFPDENVTVLRRGTLTCASTDVSCTFILDLPEDVRSAD